MKSITVPRMVCEASVRSLDGILKDKWQFEADWPTEAQMTKTIAELAAEEFELSERVRSMGMSNTAGLDYEERKKNAIAYAEARAAAAQARRELDAAIMSYGPMMHMTMRTGEVSMRDLKRKARDAGLLDGLPLPPDYFDR